jgi:hypothetical protein
VDRAGFVHRWTLADDQRVQVVRLRAPGERVGCKSKRLRGFQPAPEFIQKADAGRKVAQLMSQSVALPDQPTKPKPVLPPHLENTDQPVHRTPDEILASGKEVARAIKKYVRTDRSLRLLLDGKKYPYAPVWQFCAACFGVTAMVTQTEELLTDDRKEMGYLATAHAIDARGRVISGAEATCMFGEPEWQNSQSFAVRSMAQTRAVSKVLSNLYRWVMVLAGFAPTPAEEMGGAGKKREREITTPCYECGNKVTKKRALQTRKKYGRELCLDCSKKADDGATGMTRISDPAQVAEHIAQVKTRKANGGAQPVVAAMDAGKEEIA